MLGASLAAGACSPGPSRVVAPPYGMPAQWHEEQNRKIQSEEAGLAWKVEPSSPSLSASMRASLRLRITVTNAGTETVVLQHFLGYVNIDGTASNELSQALSEAAGKASWGHLAPGQSAQCELAVGALLPETPGGHEISMHMRTREAWRVRVEVTAK